MPTAENNIITPSRRTILGGAGPALAGVAFIACSPSAGAEMLLNPDAEQIKLCEEHVNLSLQHLSVFPDGENAVENDNERFAIQGPIRDRQNEIEELLYEMRSKTLAGIRARALAAATYSPGYFEGEDELDAGLTNSIIRDLVNLKKG